MSEKLIMKIYPFSLFLLMLIFLAPLVYGGERSPQTASAPPIEVQIKDVVSNPGKYNGKKVTLEGKVTKVDYRKSARGELFTVFRLKDSENNEVGVYYEDARLPISKGDTVRIKGKFWKEKSYFLYKLKNVIKAGTVDVI